MNSTQLESMINFMRELTINDIQPHKPVPELKTKRTYCEVDDIVMMDTDVIIKPNKTPKKTKTPKAPKKPNTFERTPIYSETNGRWYLSCGCNRNYATKTSAMICHSGRRYKSRKSGPSPCDFGFVNTNPDPMDI